MASIEEIKRVISDRENEIKSKFKKENIIKRSNIKEIESYIGRDTALIISGIRRCGKSTLAFMLGKENKYGYINFEDERLDIEGKELNKVIEALYSLKKDLKLLIFDEIQNIEGWEKFISRLLPNKKIIITGSNARLSSKELATYLTGRHIDYTLFPFSFKEYLKWKGVKANLYLTKERPKIKKKFKNYIKNGGFPLTYSRGRIFLSETYKDIVERDVIQRYNIKYKKTFKNLTKYLLSNSTNEITYNKLKNIFKIKSSHTVKKYISYLEDSYLIFQINRFSYKLKEQVLTPKKVYCIDTGMLDVIGFMFSENKGKFLENSVAIKLLRKVINNNALELYYWKNHQQKEVDFVLKNNKKVERLIQVSDICSEKEIRKREIASLIEASKELKCKDLLIITNDYEDKKIIENKEITFMPAWKWHLE